MSLRRLAMTVMEREYGSRVAACGMVASYMPSASACALVLVIETCQSM